MKTHPLLKHQEIYKPRRTAVINANRRGKFKYENGMMKMEVMWYMRSMQSGPVKKMEEMTQKNGRRQHEKKENLRTLVASPRQDVDQPTSTGKV
jgi:antitoxin component YwqK of YwqJK toxin-antitoxin module